MCCGVGDPFGREGRAFRFVRARATASTAGLEGRGHDPAQDLLALRSEGEGAEMAPPTSSSALEVTFLRDTDVIVAVHQLLSWCPWLLKSLGEGARQSVCAPGLLVWLTFMLTLQTILSKRASDFVLMEAWAFYLTSGAGNDIGKV